jgi:hypothetical protein
MATYGLQTIKADNSTVVFQNSSKSGVFARTYTCVPTDATLINGTYRKEFPEYNGRTMRVFQLKSGNAVYNSGITTQGLNIIEFTIVSAPSLTDPKFTVGNTILYIFIK